MPLLLEPEWTLLVEYTLGMSSKIGKFAQVIRITWSSSYATKVSHEYWKSQTRSHVDRTASQWSEFLAGIEDRLALSPDDRVLDYGCGNGEIASYIARKGFQVSGCDISENLLARARVRGVDCNHVSEVIEGDRRFTKIYMHGVFMYIHPRKRAGFLRQMYALLEPYGTLYLLAEPDLDKREYASVHQLQKLFAPVFPVYAIFNAGFWTNTRSLTRKAQKSGYSAVKVYESGAYRSDFVLTRAA